MSLIRNETWQLHPTEQIPSLLVNNKKLKDPKIVSSAFNNFYSYYWTIKHKGDAFSFLKDPFPVNFPSLKTIPTTAAENTSIILSLKTKNSAIYNEIKSKILKTCFTVISHPLSFILNYSVYTSIFPDHFKITIVNHCTKKETNIVWKIISLFSF